MNTTAPLLNSSTQFCAVEMQAIVAVLMGKKLTAVTLTEIACAGLSTHADLLRSRSMLGSALDIKGLQSKLAQLAWSDKVDLAGKLGRLLDRHPGDYFFGRVPSRNALAAFGLIEPEGSPARGFAVALNSHRVWEYVLRDEPRNQPLARLPLAELVEHADFILSAEPFCEEDLNMLTAVFRAITEKTGWRYFRVVRFGEQPARLVQTKPRELLSDLDDGSLDHVVLEGINAPLPDGGVLI